MAATRWYRWGVIRRDEWVQVERDDLAEARAASDAKSLAERMEEAIAWACVAVSEIARVARDDEDLARRLEGDFAPSLRERWERLGRR